MLHNQELFSELDILMYQKIVIYTKIINKIVKLIT